MERLANKKLKESNLIQKVTPLSCAYCYNNERFQKGEGVRARWPFIQFGPNYTRGARLVNSITRIARIISARSFYSPLVSLSSADYVIWFTSAAHADGLRIFADTNAQFQRLMVIS